jgi:hypothetical protein
VSPELLAVRLVTWPPRATCPWCGQTRVQTDRWPSGRGVSSKSDLPPETRGTRPFDHAAGRAGASLDMEPPGPREVLTSLRSEWPEDDSAPVATFLARA